MISELEEISKLLKAYAISILGSGSYLLTTEQLLSFTKQLGSNPDKICSLFEGYLVRIRHTH